MMGKGLQIFWKSNKDLTAVALSWLLVVGSLYTATVIVGPDVWGGMAYFFLICRGWRAAFRRWLSAVLDGDRPPTAAVRSWVHYSLARFKPGASACFWGPPIYEHISEDTTATL